MGVSARRPSPDARVARICAGMPPFGETETLQWVSQQSDAANVARAVKRAAVFQWIASGRAGSHVGPPAIGSFRSYP